MIEISDLKKLIYFPPQTTTSTYSSLYRTKKFLPSNHNFQNHEQDTIWCI